MKEILAFSLLFFASICFGQSAKTDVLTLGAFHFAFHNRDVKKIDQKDQINVFDKKYQVEIEDIVRQIVNFKPTIIAIEQSPAQQAKIDSLYQEYLNNKHLLSREEYEQIESRVAKNWVLKNYTVSTIGGETIKI